jgi:hypothetical protein
MFKLPALQATAGVVLVLSLAFAAGPSFASGSDGGGAAETGDAAAYNTGKGVYANKLACSSCPLAGKSVTADIARGLLKNQPDAKLSADESAALAVYLKRRFKL